MELKQNIILYSLSTCTRCKLVKQMLDKHNVEYEEIIDQKALMEDKGCEGAPALEINGEIIDAYTNILAWLKKNNYYSLWGD